MKPIHIHTTMGQINCMFLLGLVISLLLRLNSQTESKGPRVQSIVTGS